MSLNDGHRSDLLPGRPLWLAIVSVLAFLLGSLTVSPVFGQVPWERVEPGCATRAAEQLACGALGTYSFGSSRASSPRGAACDPLASGNDVPLALDRDRDSPDGIRGQQSVRETAATRATRGIWTELGAVATVDWDQGTHGAWVWVVLDSATNYRVFPDFYFLDHPTVPSIQAVPGASDFHVLEQLCRLIATDPVPPVLNLSFGRMLDEAPCASGDSIPCEISRALAHLRNDRGVTVLAAAGNHGELLFPASDGSTFAVGSLDLETFWPSGNTTPSSNTPSGYDALMPGHGLVRVNHPDLDGSSVRNALVPPGSSFATAFLSGWLWIWEDASPGALARLRADDPALLSIAVGPDGFYLAADGVPYLDSRFDSTDTVLRIAVGLEPEAFEDEVYSGSYQFALSASPLSLVLPSGRPHLTLDTNLPTPGSEPCVPCRLRRRGGRAPAGTIPVVIEVGTRSPADGGTIEEVYLQLGDDLYGLEGAGYASFVAGIEVGDDVTLDLDLPETLLDGRPVSLVVVFARDVDQEEFWDAIPLALHLDTRELLFGSTFEGGLVWWSN